MVLESLFPAKKIESKPLDMLLLSLIVSAVSIFVAYIIFPHYSGVIAPLLVTVAMTPVVYRIFIHEEIEEREVAEHKKTETFWQMHGDVVILFSLFFIGNFVSVLIISVLAPIEFVSTAFSQQLADIVAIQHLSGAATTSAVVPSLLQPIVMNNLRVMLFCFVLSFLFATGALFILSWNASILALYLANFIRQGLYSQLLVNTMGILPHTPVEIAAYFLAGIAGGMLSVGFIREKVLSREFGMIFRDSLIMLGLSIAAVLVGGLLEVYI